LQQLAARQQHHVIRFKKHKDNTNVSHELIFIFFLLFINISTIVPYSFRYLPTIFQL